MTFLEKAADRDTDLIDIGFGLKRLGSSRGEKNGGRKRQQKTKTRFHEKRGAFKVAELGVKRKPERTAKIDMWRVRQPQRPIIQKSRKTSRLDADFAPLAINR